MSLLIDTVNDLKAQGPIDMAALRSVALERSFELLDEDSQLEVCESLKELQSDTWAEQEKSAALSREHYARQGADQ